MDETRKKELFPYFAYLYSQQMNPDKYGQIESMEEWIKTIQESEEDAQQIVAAAEELSDEDWASIDEQYSSQKSEGDAVLAAKGAKLKKLKSKAKKCKCGCDMVTVKEKGGKMISKCSCGCGDVKKGAKGFKSPVAETRTLSSSKPTIAGSVSRPKAISSELDLSVQRGLNQQLANDSKQIGETFNQAFARNRKSGMKEFTFNGKRYTTQLASDVKPATSTKTVVPTTKTIIPTTKTVVPTTPSTVVPTTKTIVPTAKPTTIPASVVPTTPTRIFNPDTFYQRYGINPRVSPNQGTLRANGMNPVGYIPPLSRTFMKKGGVVEKQAGGPVKPTTKPVAKPKGDTSKVDNSPERLAAKKYKSEFYSKNGTKYDTQSGLPIAPMKPAKKQSGGDINQQIGTTKKGGKTKRIPEKKVVVVPPPALKKGKKVKTKK